MTELNFIMPNQTQACISAGKINPECLLKNFCPQLPGYLGNAAIWLLLAYLAIDFLLPVFFYRIMPRLSWGFLGAFKHDTGSQEKVIYWLKNRLLFAMAVLCGYLIYFTHI